MQNNKLIIRFIAVFNKNLKGEGGMNLSSINFGKELSKLFKKINFTMEKLYVFLLSLFLIFSLFVISNYNYLLFHSIAEGFSIIIAFGIFIVVWNSRKYIENNFFIVIGIAFVFVSGLDFIHALTYKGMAIIPDQSANIPTQLWIAARYMQSITLLSAPLLIKRRIRIYQLITIYFAVTVIILASIFYWRIFPDCYIEGVGLTSFKRISEYFISLILVSSILVLFKKRRQFDRYLFNLVIAAIIINIASEINLTFYESVYAFPNLLGHLLKIVSFYLMYKAIIVSGLKDPFNVLFGMLKQNEKALQLTRFSVDHAEDLIFWINLSGTIVDINETVSTKLGYSKDQMLNQPFNIVCRDFNLKDFLTNDFADAFTIERQLFNSSGSKVDVEIKFNFIEFGGEKYYCAIARDITERKLYGEQLENSLKEKVVLLKEIHHRVKNNLQVISSLFNLQSAYIKDNEAREIFVESQNRVKTMALVHEKLYLSKNLSHVNFSDYVHELIVNLFGSYKFNSNKIDLVLNIEDIDITVDYAVNIGLIINELVSNSLKHAFIYCEEKNSDRGELKISLNPDGDGKVILSVKDNGIGFPANLDFRYTETLGMQLVNSLVNQLKGEIELRRNAGTEFILTFSKYNF